MLLCRVFLLIILANFQCFSVGDCDCLDQFLNEGLSPDIIPENPKAALQIIYGKDEDVCGSKLGALTTLKSPNIVYEADDSQLYTLIMMDLDAISYYPPFLSPYRHWIVTNIPGNKVKEGREDSSYTHPLPPPFLGAHRYIFLVYKQSATIDSSDLKDDFFSKMGFDLKEYLQTNQLQGPPVAGGLIYVKTL